MTIPERTITLANELRAAWLNDASPSGAFAWFARCLQAERDAHALAVHQIACLAEKPKPEDVAKVAAFVIAAARRQTWTMPKRHSLFMRSMTRRGLRLARTELPLSLGS